MTKSCGCNKCADKKPAINEITIHPGNTFMVNDANGLSFVVHNTTYHPIMWRYGSGRPNIE